MHRDDYTEKRRELINSFGRIDLSADAGALAPALRTAVEHVKRAMDELHEIFIEQQSEEHAELLRRRKEGGGELGEFYRRFEGPWNPVDDYASCDPEVPDRDPRCSFYPADMSAEEFRLALAALSEDEREALESPTTLVKRDENGGLIALPYHVAYAERLAGVFEELEKAADDLEEAGEEELAEYLRTRAEGLVTGAYRDADSAWVRLSGVPLEIVIGPYEVYADGLLGRKAMYEGMLMAVDRERCERLREVEENLDLLAEHFPLPAGSRPARGGIAPMVVVSQLYNAGEARQPVFPSAFNLPNDPWVRGHVGWKQVMLYNVMKAKFEGVTLPMSARFLGGVQKPEFEPLFYFVLLHEVSHGLGPAYRSDGSSVDNNLGPYYTAIEEAKADTGGLDLLLNYGGSCGIPDFDEEKVFASFAAALHRAMRFGTKEAHGAANVIEFNRLLERGGIERGDDGYRIHPAKARKANRQLLEELCRLQAEGTEKEAGAFIERWAVPDDILNKLLADLADFPIDLFLEF